MSTPTIYNTQDSKALAAVDAHRQANDQYLERLDAFIAEHLPAGSAACITRSLGAPRLACFKLPEGETLPGGWRDADRGPRTVVPRLNTKIGKAAAAAMAGLSLAPNLMDAIPMCAAILTGDRMFSPGVRVLEATV